MFTWPFSEHSQVPLAHITLRYSCYQALASGAARVRYTEQKQRQTKRNDSNRKTEKAQMQKVRMMCKSAQILLSFLTEFPIICKTQDAAVHRSSASPCLWKRASAPTSLHSPSENRSPSLMFAWKLKPHVESTSVATHQPHSSCCSQFTRYWLE